MLLVTDQPNSPATHVLIRMSERPQGQPVIERPSKAQAPERLERARAGEELLLKRLAGRLVSSLSEQPGGEVTNPAIRVRQERDQSG